MTTRSECYVLLKSGWEPELDELCAELQSRFPALGPVTATAAERNSGVPDKFAIDGATVEMNIVRAPFPPEQLTSPLRLTDPVDTEAVGRAHVAYVILASEYPEGNPELGEAFSALLTLICSVVCEQAPALAAFWKESWRLRTPAEMSEAAAAVMQGRAPRDLWISFAEVRAAKVGGMEMRGMMSFGLRNFCDREVEVAPAPVDPETALEVSRLVAARLMDGDTLEDRQEIALTGFGEPAILRLTDRFMRPRQPVALLVLPGATVDPETLETRRSSTASKPGGSIVSRIFSSRG